jgi:hypothetical protein
MSISAIIVGYSLVFLLALSLTILLFIVLRRIYLRARDRKMNAITEKLETEILKSMSAPDDRKAIKVAKKYTDVPKVLTRVLVNYVKTISGPERERLKLIYNRTLKDRLLQDIRSRFIHIRLRAIRPFVMFADEADFPQIVRMIQDKPPIRLAVIDALSSIPHPFVISRLFEAFAESSATDLRAFMNVMYSLGKRIEDQMRPYLTKSMPGPKLEILIELAGALPLPGLYDRILLFAGHPEKEVRIRVARALGRLNILAQPVKDTLIRLAADEAWEVQAQALKSLGKLRISSALDSLHNALFSPHWHCRRNAGFALANMGDKGIRQLKKAAAQTEDRYAGDMARMVLEEMEFEQEAG